MKLILLRHGEAGQADVDAERDLTDRGRDDMTKMSRFIRATGWQVREILCSPLRRTRTTAGIVSAELGGPEAEPDDRLAPGAPRSGLTGLLTEVTHQDAAIWVFHAPDVSLIAAALTGAPESGFYVSPGTMLALNLPMPRPESRSVLVWAMQPEFACPALELG